MIFHCITYIFNNVYIIGPGVILALVMTNIPYRLKICFNTDRIDL
jgi:hypothetical protein